ncbi:hypothetical protein GGX14DRAFT_545844 [Mycena pura]|uniref:Uncharacterized protein n=1 Tax=Mycena pura TaxID=153505 RepID=A0AAD6UX29_9AGAR|nr:hypothetical protein GGX14DRAFT_545844 [Mycena pura]
MEGRVIYLTLVQQQHRKAPDGHRNPSDRGHWAWDSEVIWGNKTKNTIFAPAQTACQGSPDVCVWDSEVMWRHRGGLSWAGLRSGRSTGTVLPASLWDAPNTISTYEVAKLKSYVDLEVSDDLAPHSAVLLQVSGGAGEQCLLIAADTPRLQQPGIRVSHLARSPRSSLPPHSTLRTHLGVPSARPPSAPRRHPSSISPTASPVSAPTAFWDARASSSTTPHIAQVAALLASHEHQDAQDLFQLLSECVREENTRIGHEGARDRGFAGVAAAAAPADDDAQAGVLSSFDGLTATRACLHYGYTAAMCHFVFDTVQLATRARERRWGLVRAACVTAAGGHRAAVPRWPCQTGMRMQTGTTQTPARARRRVHQGGARGRVGLDARRGRKRAARKGMCIERVSGDVCTRQSMLGRPPAVLALHMNRSVHTALHVARVVFPELLDLTLYTTTTDGDSVLSLNPTTALSDAMAHRGARVTGEAGYGDAHRGAGGEVHGVDRCFIWFSGAPWCRRFCNLAEGIAFLRAVQHKRKSYFLTHAFARTQSEKEQLQSRETSHELSGLTIVLSGQLILYRDMGSQWQT